MSIGHRPYPSDTGDEEWSLVAPYLPLPREEAGRRGHDRRQDFDGLRCIVKTSAPAMTGPSAIGA